VATPARPPAAPVPQDPSAPQTPAVPQTPAAQQDPMVMVNRVRYKVLECVGRGGSCKVYKVIAPNNKILALKRIKLEGRDVEAAQGFMDEITLLKRLRGVSNIIQLMDFEVAKVGRERIILVVLEFGETDFARLLQRQAQLRQERGLSGWDENFVRLYWEQMLHAVKGIHEARIVHSDLKPANFLVVEGHLKLIDFGIAKAMHGQDTTSIFRENQVGTLNYMSPEAIKGNQHGAKVGRASDVWSLGCILYQMVFGHTPFAHLPMIQKIHAIANEGTPIEIPGTGNPACEDAVRRCLDRNPKTRITIEQLLDHPFLHPGRAAAAPTPGPALSREQLEVLLAQMCQAQGKQAGPDVVGSMADTVMRQLQAGQALNLMQFFA